MSARFEDLRHPLPPEWRWVTLGDVGRWVSGGTPNKSTPLFWESGRVPWLTPKDMKRLRIDDTIDHVTELGATNGSRLAPARSVFIVVRGMILAHTFPVCLSMRPMAFNQDVKAIECDEAQILPEYLATWLAGNAASLLRTTTESTHGTKRIALEDIQPVPFALPPVREQERIMKMAADVDDAIARTEAMIEKLRVLSRGLSDSLFANSAGWRSSDVEREFDITAGFTLGPHRTPRSHPHKYLRVANVQRGLVDLSEVLELDASPDEVAAKCLQEGDLLVVEGHANPDEIGRCALVPYTAAGMTFQNHLFRLRAHTMLPRFAEAWMNSPIVRSHWRTRCGTSSGLNTINRTMLKRVDVRVPPLAEQQRIVAILDAHDARIRAEQTERDKLVALKRGLLDDLLTGRVRVPAATSTAT